MFGSCKPHPHAWHIDARSVPPCSAGCILGVGYNVLISSRATDVRAAQQLGSLIILPFGAVYFLTEFGFLDLNTDNLLYMAVAMLVIDAIIFYSIRVTFNRDEILTKWR